MEIDGRDLRVEAGLDDRPVILVCGDSGALPTGVARVIRGICEPIVDRGNFQVVQHGWFHLATGQVPVNYHVIPVRRHKVDKAAFDPEDKWGQSTFEKVVASVQPDIVFAVADYTRVDHIRKSPQRTSFAFVHYIPLDTLPPNPRWGEVVQAPDAAVFYTKLGLRWGTQANVVGTYIPHGVDTEVYRPPSNDERRALRQKFFGIEANSDRLVIGSVGRNQRRKRHDLLIEAYSHLYHGGYSHCGHCERLVLHGYVLPGGYFEAPDACPHCGTERQFREGRKWEHAALYLHTDPEEPSSEAMPLTKLAAIWQVGAGVRFNPHIELRMAKGLSNEMLASFYQCMDVYVHTADGGGWELPPMEAAACGVPVVAVDAPAQNEWLHTLPGAKMVQGDAIFLKEMDGYRVFGRLEHLVEQLLAYLEDAELRKQHGKANAEWAQDYRWPDISEQFEAVFTEVLDPSTRIEPWRILVEA